MRRPAAGALPVLAGLCLGAGALGPALGRGFLLRYDMVFVPRPPITAATFGLTGPLPRAVPSDAVAAALARVLPGDVAQKLLLLSVFVLACAGAAELLSGEHILARLAAGVFYAWNPFVAERLLIGQWALLLGYAGLPWVLRAAGMGAAGSWRGAWRLCLALLPAAAGGFAAMTVSALLAIPAAVAAPVAAAATAAPVGPGRQRHRSRSHAVLGARMPRRRGRPARQRTRRVQRVRAVAATLLVLVVLSLPWLIPSLLRAVSTDPAGADAFAARADTPFGSVGSLLMLGGLWNAQTVPSGYGGAESAYWLALVLAAIAGFTAGARGAAYWRGLAIAAAAGLAIACIGVSAPGRTLLRGLIGAWPGFAVLRDGQQFVAPLALAEACGVGAAVTWLMPRRRLRPMKGTFSNAGSSQAHPAAQPGFQRGVGPGLPARPDKPGLAIGVAGLLAPVLFLPGLAWGAAGRLQPVGYPADWLTAQRLIDTDPAGGDALLLPWAAYRGYPWNEGAVVLDPWPRLLSRPVIRDDGVQVGSLRLAPEDPQARELDHLVRSAAPLTAALRQAGVRYVIVDAPADSSHDLTVGRPADAYPFASRLPGCQVVFARPDLIVYRLPNLGLCPYISAIVVVRNCRNPLLSSQCLSY